MRGSSDGRDERSVVADGSMFHDLEKMYPDAPIPEEGGQILRNAVIDGSDSSVLMDHGSQEHGYRDVSNNCIQRLSAVIDPLMIFVEQQLGGQLPNWT